MIEKQRSIDFELASIDPLVLSVVRTEANRLAGSCGFSYGDRDDIRQELLLDCLVRLRRFNASRSSRRTFLYRVVRHRVGTLRESQSAACRDYRLCTDSLDGPAHLVTSKSIILGDTTSTDTCEARIGQYSLSSWEREELRIDVNKVISTLPYELAVIANLLRCIGAVDAAHQLGMPRATLYRRIATIRKAFKAAGLDRCLKRRRTTPLGRALIGHSLPARPVSRAA